MQYFFTPLGTDAFERMAQALAVAHLGTSVQPLGGGGDGGRDAFFDGAVSHSGHLSNNWSGYGVIQAKHIMRDVDPVDNVKWVKAQLRKELSKWLPGKLGERAQRVPLPEYYLFMTSARLTPAGFDECMDALAEWAQKLGLKDFDLWADRKIATLLDNNTAIRRTYLHLISAGDVLAALEEVYTNSSTFDVGRHVVVNAARDLATYQWARLSDSGLATEERFLLSAIAVDVPSLTVEVEVDREDWVSTNALSHIIELGNKSLRHSNSSEYRGLLIIGGPGQGKSTLAHLACQIYRAALLEDSNILSTQQRKLVSDVHIITDRIGIQTPTVRRWPIHVDLSKYGDQLAADQAMSLLKFMSFSVKANGDSIRPNDLASWRRAWPWVVVLDGLDEVPNPTIRELIRQAVDEFITDCNAVDADVLILATTRPQGYKNELDAYGLETIELSPLSPAEALRYGMLLSRARYASDELTQTQVIQRLKAATKADNTALLMTTPLQVTIMASLLARNARLPETRHALFDEYYNVIYSRESAKAGWLGDLLTSHRATVNHVHEQVALYLHVQAERPGSAQSLIPSSQIAQLILAHLILSGHTTQEAEGLAQKLVRAVRDRVVLLVGMPDDHVGFEVRSIQEYLAARALTIGDETSILKRLEVLVPSIHWRNVWLLAAARLQQHSNPSMVDSIVQTLRRADELSILSMHTKPGQGLAIDLLEDEYAKAMPRIRRSLVAHALGAFDAWGDDRFRRLEIVLSRELTRDSLTKSMVRTAAERSMKSAGGARCTTVAVLTRWQRQTGQPAVLANAVLNSNNDWRPSRHDAVRQRSSVGDIFRDYIDPSSPKESEIVSLCKALDAVEVRIGLSASEVATYIRSPRLPNLVAVQNSLEQQLVAESAIHAMERMPESVGAAAVYVTGVLVGIIGTASVGDNSVISPPGSGLF
jgi:hypothetical protein